ncbi:MAG: glycoside hydrolase family 5 protein [Pseudomonadota bacterium]
MTEFCRALKPIAALVLAWAWLTGIALAQSGSAYPNYNFNPIAPDQSGMGSTAVEVAARMHLGWNIGNTLEATGGETAWGNPEITKRLIDLAKASGFDAIRLPVAWNGHADARTARIDEAWLRRVRQVVQYCVDDDLHVIVNVHWDGGWLERNVDPAKAADVNARQRALWQQIATTFRDFDQHVIFASANEPHAETTEQMGVLLSYHQSFVDAVRATGGRNAYRVLVVQGPNTDIDKTDQLWRTMPSDPAPDRLMLEVHYYTPYNFTGMTEDQSWGRQFYYWGEGFHSRTDPDHNPTWGEEHDVDALFARMKHKFVDAGIPVIIGEFGAMRRDSLQGDALALHLASRAHYLEYVTHLATTNGMVPFYWDSGGLDHGGSGIFDRRAYRVFDQAALNAMLQGAGRRAIP